MMMRKDLLTDFPVRPPALGVATNVYLPGLSLRPARRPVKRNLLLPVRPLRVKLPRSVTMRVHLRARRLRVVGATQRARLPVPVLRPGCACCTVKRTVAA